MATQKKLVDGGDVLIPQFYGLQTAVKNPKELLLGQPRDSLNFITGYNTKTKTGDNIQLRAGSALLCATRLGAGKISALAVGLDSNGKQWPFFVAGGQAYYFNPATGDWATIADGSGLTVEDMTMEYYQDLFGPYMYTGSPNTGIRAISVASKQMVNIGSGNISGYLTIRQNFGWVWNWINSITGIAYTNNLRQSQSDQVDVSGTGISNPQGNTGVAGNGVLKVFSGIIFGVYGLAFTVQIGAPIDSQRITKIVVPGDASQTYNVYMADTSTYHNGDYVVVQGVTEFYIDANDKIGTVFYVYADHLTITLLKSSGVNTNTYTPLNFGTISKLEMFEDDGNGNLKSLLGSVGTINYITGAFTINTQTAIPNGLNLDSICFTGVPGVATYLLGFWAQFGGPTEAVKFFSNGLYVFHTINTWLINLGFASSSTTTGTSGQQQYRQNLGTSYFRAAYENGDGILFLDNTEHNNPHFKIVGIASGSTAIIPTDLSAEMDFSQYDPSTCVVGNVGNYNFLSLQSVNNAVSKGYNDTTFVRNNISGFYDKTDLRIAVMDTYNGSIIAGDTISQNVMVLFNGQDDDGAPINAFWTSGQMHLGTMGLKQYGFFHIDGFIGPSQVCNIYAQYDAGSYVWIGAVYGNGNYVDQNNSILVGQGLSGANPIGGLGNGQLTGYYFTQDIPIWTPLFQYVSIKFVPGINVSGNIPQPAYGALQINAGWGFRDVRIKSQKSPANTIGK